MMATTESKYTKEQNVQKFWQGFMGYGLWVMGYGLSVQWYGFREWLTG
jgi:hypothetical protein